MSQSRLFTRNVDPSTLRVRWMPSWLLRLCGLHRRRLGLYDAATISLLRRAWERQPTVKNLLAYVRVARDLGHPLVAEQAKALLDDIEQLSSLSLHQALNLLIEGDHLQQPQSAVPLAVMQKLAETSPPVAHAAVEAGGVVSDPGKRLAKMHANQPSWREQFGDYLRDADGAVCVAGNAAALLNSALGEKIDSHRVVVRFNRYRSDSSQPVDIGARTDVWVRAPDLGEFAGAGAWVILSGPDSRYQLTDWRQLLPLLQKGAKVITVPLPVWRRLVEELGAPPSSGVLFLAWAIELLGAAEAVTAAGFQGLDASEQTRRYHQALPKHQSSRRHHWSAERTLLRRWQDQGLRVLS